MKKLTILLDCDGVLADFVGGYLREVELAGGGRWAHDVVDKMEIKSCDFMWEASKHWGTRSSPDLSREARRDQFVASVEGVIQQSGWCSRLAPFKRAQDAVRQLIGHNVYVVTSPWKRSPTWGYDRAQWLEKHFAIPHDRVISTKAKHQVRGDVFIDDDPVMVTHWQMGTSTGTSRLWDAPYNQDAAGPRVVRWDDVLQLVSDLS